MYLFIFLVLFFQYLPHKLCHDVGEFLVEVPVGISLVELHKDNLVEVGLSSNLLEEGDHSVHVSVHEAPEGGSNVLDGLVGIQFPEHLDEHLDILLAL